MQTTLRINEEIYRQAKAKAARDGITLTKFIEEALCLRLEQASANPSVILESSLNESASSSLAQPENRFMDNQGRADLIKRLESLFDQVDKRDFLKEGSAGQFSREELYAERLDRFR